MILSGKQIKEKLHKDIIIEPFHEKQLNPNSYNLCLHNELLAYEDEILDMKKQHTVKKIVMDSTGFLLEPNRLYLGRTVEYTKTDRYVPMLEGRSSVGRLGIFIHITAGFGDVGFAGYWTLEISCIQPVRIYPFVAICQIFYHSIEGDYTSYVSNKYQNNRGVQPSMLYKDFEIEESL